MAREVRPGIRSRGDHLCRLLDGPAAFRRAAVEYLDEGLRRGERALYVADGATDDMLADLDGLGDVTGLVGGGALLLASTGDLYAHGGGFDRVGQIARYRRLTGEAIAGGYTGLRVAADATALVLTESARREFIRYEIEVDGLMAAEPMSAMCAYDVSVLGPAAGELCSVHRRDDAPPEVAPGFRLTFGPAGLHLEGEVDMVNRDLFAVALDAAARCAGPHVVIDAADLAFVDVRSMCELGRLHEALSAQGGQLTVVGARSSVRRCAEVLGYEGLIAERGSGRP